MELSSGIIGNDAGLIASEKLVADYGKLFAEGKGIEAGFKVS